MTVQDVSRWGVKAEHAAKKPQLTLDGWLAEGETVVTVVRVTKISPTIDLVAITTERVLGFSRRAKPGTTPPVAIPIGQVANAIVTGFMSNLAFHTVDSEIVKVGTLRSQQDNQLIRRALAEAKKS